MPLNQNISFLYNTQVKGISVERSNIVGPLVLNALKTWVFNDRLNQLNEVIVTIVKANVDVNKIFLEREVFISGFNFRGIITGLADLNDEILEIRISELAWHFTRRLYKIADTFKEYKLELVSTNSFHTYLQAILTSANSDMPFNWRLGTEDINDSTTFSFDVKWKNYYEVLRLIALNTANDIWFEDKTVIIGTKGKTITLDRESKLYKKLNTSIDLDTYGNIVTVVGASVDSSNVHATASNMETDLLYNYEKVISNNNLKDQAAVDGVVNRVLTDFDSIAPDVTVDILFSTVAKYDMKSGDIIKINSNTSTQTVKGFYRLIEVTSSNTKNVIKLQYSKNGKFLPRVSDSLDILSAVLIKIHELELNS